MLVCTFTEFAKVYFEGVATGIFLWWLGMFCYVMWGSYKK
jgi:hypothetical protein